MHRNRWFILSICAYIAMAGCSNGETQNEASGASRVRDLAAQLEEAGVGCVSLTVRQPDPESGEAPSPVPGGVGIPQLGSGPVASEHGFCVLEDAPEIQGQSLASLILVFDDDEHLDRLPPTEVLAGQGPIPEQALVYGDTWEMFVVPVSKAEAIADALGGTVLPAD
jgi:hypothetical protein